MGYDETYDPAGDPPGDQFTPAELASTIDQLVPEWRTMTQAEYAAAVHAIRYPEPWTPDDADARELAGAYHSIARRGANAIRSAFYTRALMDGAIDPTDLDRALHTFAPQTSREAAAFRHAVGRVLGNPFPPS